MCVLNKQLLYYIDNNENKSLYILSTDVIFKNYFSMLGIESRALNMVEKHSTLELHPQPLNILICDWLNPWMGNLGICDYMCQPLLGIGMYLSHEAHSPMEGIYYFWLQVTNCFREKVSFFFFQLFCLSFLLSLSISLFFSSSFFSHM